MNQSCRAAATDSKLKVIFQAKIRKQSLIPAFLVFILGLFLVHALKKKKRKRALNSSLFSLAMFRGNVFLGEI